MCCVLASAAHDSAALRHDTHCRRLGRDARRRAYAYDSRHSVRVRVACAQMRAVRSALRDAKEKAKANDAARLSYQTLAGSTVLDAAFGESFLRTGLDYSRSHCVVLHCVRSVRTQADLACFVSLRSVSLLPLLCRLERASTTMLAIAHLADFCQHFLTSLKAFRRFVLVTICAMEKADWLFSWRDRQISNLLPTV